MRKIILYGVIIFQILLIVSLVRGIQLSSKSRSRITDLEERKSQLMQESQKIKEEGEYVQSPHYLEKVARDELNMAKPGETVVIVPDNLRMTSRGESEEREAGEKENWQKWWEVLSGRIWELESGQDGNASVLKTDVRKD